MYSWLSSTRPREIGAPMERQKKLRVDHEKRVSREVKADNGAELRP
jgi:hypothetical protein